MSFFNERLKKGTKFENDVDIYLTKLGYIITDHGYERTHTKIQSEINEWKDETSKFIRYQPDRFAVDITTKTSFLYEQKNGDQIEKDAYLTYMNLYSIGCDILLFIKNKKKNVYKVNVENIKFIDSKKIINNMPNYFIKPPIDEEGWISPRLLNKKDYYKWKNKTRGSGTPYKYFDFENMEEYILKDFKCNKKIIKKSNNNFVFK